METWEAWKHGGMELRRHGNTEAWKHGGMETWRHGHGNMGMGTWHVDVDCGGMVTEIWTWKHGNGDMDVKGMDTETWTRRNERGNMDMETRSWSWKHGHGDEKNYVIFFHTKKMFCMKSTKVSKNGIELKCTTLENHENSEFRQTSRFGIPGKSGGSCCQFRQKFESKNFRRKSVDTLAVDKHLCPEAMFFPQVW
jgi:hypothetical protein